MNKLLKLCLMGTVVISMSSVFYNNISLAAKNDIGEYVLIDGNKVAYDKNIPGGGVAGNNVKKVANKKIIDLNIDTKINQPEVLALSTILNSLSLNKMYDEKSIKKFFIKNKNSNEKMFQNSLNELLLGTKFKYTFQNNIKAKNINIVRDNMVTAIDYGNPVLAVSKENKGDIFYKNSDSENILIISGYENYGDSFEIKNISNGRFMNFASKQKISLESLTASLEGESYAW